MKNHPVPEIMMYMILTIVLIIVIVLLIGVTTMLIDEFKKSKP